MYEYKLGDLARMWSAILVADRDLLASERMGKERPDAEYVKHLAVALDGLAICCANFEADPSLIAQMRNLERDLKNDKADTRCPVLHARLRPIIDGVHNNLNSRQFMFIPQADVGYWGNIKLFGDDFGIAFPVEAVFELIELGKCFAASRSTACVFHSMRIAEYGLRILAKNAGVKLTDKGKPIPIEYGTWDKVISAVRNRIIETRKQPIGPRKEKDLQFYSSAADHCDYMKDIWRNELAHSRHRFYTRDETLGVMSRVRLFSELIAKHEIPKNPRKHLEKIERRIREFQANYEGATPRFPRRTQIKIGAGQSKGDPSKESKT